MEADSQIQYVCKRALEVLRQKVKAGDELTPDLFYNLTLPEHIADDETMIPVDMSALTLDLSEESAQEMGPRGAAEAYLRAQEYFDANRSSAGERPSPMSAAEWKRTLEEE